MLVVLLHKLSAEWVDRITRQVAEQAMVLTADETGKALDILWSLPISIIVTAMESLTIKRLQDFEQLTQAAPAAVSICLAPQPIIDQIRTEELLTPDFWLRPAAGLAQIAEVVTGALQKATLVGHATQLLDASTTGAGGPVSLDRTRAEPPGASASGGERPEVFHRLMAGLTGGFDTDGLLRGYVEAVVEFVRCANYCLLWRLDDADHFTVYAAQGLHPQIVEQGRLLPADNLPRWYHHNCRVLTRSELADWPDEAQAAGLARELAVFRGQVAVPLMIEGRLAGLLILGEKVLGDPYSAPELETLFVLSNYVAVQAQNFGLHEQLRRSKAYMERILSGMNSGVITLGPDEQIAICNPCAAEILQLSQKQVAGADLRCLPSPLGDYLYAAFRSPDETVAGQEVAIRGGKLTVRVSTSSLLDDEGVAVGSVMLLEDMTAEIALATERYRRERLDMLTQIVGRIAHEVKTPLTPIITYAELASRGQDDEDLADFWNDTVTPQIARLDELINKLVNMVQQPEPNFELVRPETLVEEAIGQLRASEHPQELELDLEIDRPVPQIIADPTATREALLYLLHYLRGPEGAPIGVRVTQDGTELGQSVCVSMQRLTPSSTNVPAEELFDPLRALEETGADLGPAASRIIIDNQGGRVAAKSENGQLEFQVIFPATVLDILRSTRK